MSKSIVEARRFVGLDVHAETIAVAVAERDGESRRHPEPAVEYLQTHGEAWRCGHVAGVLRGGADGLYAVLAADEARDRVHGCCADLGPYEGGGWGEDRSTGRGALGQKLSGELTPVWVPDATHEALRDLVRAREAAKADQLRARHRLGKFLLRHGRRPSQSMRA
jgi:transposase